MDTTVQLPRYDAPGRADRLDPDLLRRWNETIADTYQRKSEVLLYRRPVAGRENATLATPFFVLRAFSGSDRPGSSSTATIQSGWTRRS